MRLIKSVLVLTLGLAFGVAGHRDDTKLAIQDMTSTCNVSYHIYSVEAEMDCGSKIDWLETHGYKVLNDGNGHFWAEKR